MHRTAFPKARNGFATKEGKPSLVERYSAGLLETLKRLPFAEINRAVEVLCTAYKDDKSVFLFGNGGSASLASHLACDLGKGTVLNGSRRLRVLSLTDNIPLLTAWANDTHYEDIFAEQLRNFVQPKDIVFAISGSGNSPNVLNGLAVAKESGAFSIALIGFRGGKAVDLADLSIIVPSDDMQHIEDIHLTIAHSIFRAMREEIRSLHSQVATVGAP
jgi:D-sedoheptulose 7-phosphate isomerase